MFNPVKLVGQITKTAGEVTAIIGMGTLFIMAIIGTIAIDLVIWAALIKAANRERHNSFATGFLFAMLFSNRSSNNDGSFYKDAGLMILLSPPLTLIAIGLSILLGVPEVGLVLIAGWAIGITIVGAGVMMSVVGQGLIELGDFLEEIFTASCEATYTHGAEHDHDCASHHHPLPKRPEWHHATTVPPTDRNENQRERTYANPSANHPFFASAETSTDGDAPPAYDSVFTHT